jgi:hypothetical protein
MELLVQRDGQDKGNADSLDNYLMNFCEGDDMDVNTLPSVESDDPIEDLDLEKKLALISLGSYYL